MKHPVLLGLALLLGLAALAAVADAQEQPRCPRNAQRDAAGLCVCGAGYASSSTSQPTSPTAVRGCQVCGPVPRGSLSGVSSLGLLDRRCHLCRYADCVDRPERPAPEPEPQPPPSREPAPSREPPPPPPPPPRRPTATENGKNHRGTDHTHDAPAARCTALGQPAELSTWTHEGRTFVQLPFGSRAGCRNVMCDGRAASAASGRQCDLARQACLAGAATRGAAYIVPVRFQ